MVDKGLEEEIDKKIKETKKALAEPPAEVEEEIKKPALSRIEIAKNIQRLGS